MVIDRRRRAFRPRVALFIAGLLAALPVLAHAQSRGPQPIVHRVHGANERMEMVVNTSRILTLEQVIPQAQVNNPDILELTPLARDQIQVFAKKPGVTQVNLWGADDKVYAIDVIVLGDARELDMLLQTQFPNAALRVVPLANSVIVSGYADQPEHVSRIMQIAEDYYPKVINNITVGGVQQVLLHVKVMEISRTKIRTMGFEFDAMNGDDFLNLTLNSLIPGVNTTADFGIVDGDSQFFGFLDVLRQHNLAKVLADPTLVTVSGRPAFFNEGGEFPVLVPQSLGTVSIQYKKFGTQMDFVPIVLGNGAIRLEVRPRVSEIDPARSVLVNGVEVPGLRVREVDTGVNMRAGQTLAIAGLVQTRVESSTRSVPILGELPYVGALFRRVSEENNEIELLILVTPQLVEAMDAHEVPPCGPGTFTTSPSDFQLFARGHIEVPKCCTDGSCATCLAKGTGTGVFPTSAAVVVTPREVGVPTGAARASDHTPPPTMRHVPSATGPGERLIPSNQLNRTPPVRRAAPGAAPGLIGPIGYDVE